MTVAGTPPPIATERPHAAAEPRHPRRRISRAASSMLAHGEPMLWFTGGALVLCVVMILGLLALVVYFGSTTFWPMAIVRVQTVQDRVLMGEVTRFEDFRPSEQVVADLPPEARESALAQLDANEGLARRRLIRTGNFELTQVHFNWVSDFEVAPGDDAETLPPWAVVFERMAWGRFYGTPQAFLVDGREAAANPHDAWAMFNEHHGQARATWRQARHLEKNVSGPLNKDIERARLELRRVELEHGLESPQWQAQQQRFADIETSSRRRIAELRLQIDALDAESNSFALRVVTADGRASDMPLANIVRAYPANQLGFVDKVSIYLSRWWEFLRDDPREANSEGGVWPAIVGTVTMTMLMSLAVVPFGVLAALYLREYARGGLIVSVVRIAVNNLAGVPSIVFGVFGLGFFIYGVGSFIDGGPTWKMPSGRWFLLVVASLLAAVGGAYTAVRSARAAAQRESAPLMKWGGIVLWLAAFAGCILAIATSPYFEGFFRANLPNPTFGKGALIWASLTLALLTLPVVIVATEEALAAVPGSMREGSYACGASKWQTIRRIVLPRAMPGIMTGTILAMARGAGEVAPLMLVGVLKLAQEPPIDFTPPFIHADRSFMHLGFHVFDLGFQSQNSEASKPMVFTTTLLLIAIITVLNLAAIGLRKRLRRRFVSNQF